jgi:hypothetical protein
MRLVDTALITPTRDGVTIVQGRRALHIRGPIGWLTNTLAQLRHPEGTAKVLAGPTDALAKQLVAELQAQGWMTSEARRKSDGGRFDRQIGYLTSFGPDAMSIQSRIQGSRVAILGVGGIGSVAAQHLAACGVGLLWLIDCDTVSTHNLNCQLLFTLADVGERKVTAAACALSRLAPEVEVRTIDRRISGHQDLRCLPAGMDLLLLAADTPEDIGRIAWDWAVSVDVAVCSAAVGLELAYWGPLLVPRLGHCWHCFEKARRQVLSGPEHALEAIHAEPAQYSFGPSNSVAAAMLSHTVIRYLGTGVSGNLNRRTCFDFASGRLTFVDGGVCSCPTATKT